MRWIQRRALVLAVAAFSVVAIAGTALAGHITSGVKSYTGCLVPNDGVIIKVKEGNAPKSACTGGQTQVHLSGGDITEIAVTGALSGGGDNGKVTIGLKPEFTLPQNCATNDFAKWNGSAWVCGNYTNGTGLALSGTQFSVEENYRLPQSCASGESVIRNTASGGGAATWACDQFASADQSCSSGQFAQGVTAVGALSCAAPASGAGLQAFSASVGFVTLAGRTSVLSKTLPAGKYLLFASVELANKDLDSTSAGSCDLSRQSGTIASTSTHVVNELASAESLSLLGTIDHSGGSILLACTETIANVDVDAATLVAIKVDSIG